MYARPTPANVAVPAQRGDRRPEHLASDRAHRPWRLAEPRLADPVLQLLAPDGVPNDRFELVVGDPPAQRCPEVGLIHREQAGPQLAVGREANSVAIGAGGLGDGIDESDLTLAVGEAEHPRRRRRLSRQLLERMG